MDGRFLPSCAFASLQWPHVRTGFAGSRTWESRRASFAYGRRHVGGYGGKVFSIDWRFCQSDGRARPPPFAFRIPSWRLFTCPARDRAAERFERRKGPCRCVIRVLIVAASPLSRAGLQSMLADSRAEVAGSAADLDSISGQLLDVEPDVVLVEAAAANSPEELLDALEDTELARAHARLLLSEHLKPPWISQSLPPARSPLLPPH